VVNLALGEKIFSRFCDQPISAGDEARTRLERRLARGSSRRVRCFLARNNACGNAVNPCLKCNEQCMMHFMHVSFLHSTPPNSAKLRQTFVSIDNEQPSHAHDIRRALRGPSPAYVTIRDPCGDELRAGEKYSRNSVIRTEVKAVLRPRVDVLGGPWCVLAAYADVLVGGKQVGVAQFTENETCCKQVKSLHCTPPTSAEPSCVTTTNHRHTPTTLTALYVSVHRPVLPSNTTFVLFSTDFAPALQAFVSPTRMLRINTAGI
jgi:hypothetical protein